MALKFQNLQVVLDSGVDAKSDRKVVTTLTRAENCVWSSPGAVKKRYGYTQLSTTGITSCVRLACHDDTLTHFDGEYVRSYSPVLGFSGASDAQKVPEAVVSSRSVGRDPNNLTFCDSSVIPNAPHLLVTAWSNTRAAVASVYVTITDLTTGAVVLDNRVLDQMYPGSSVRCVGAGDYVAIGYIDSTGMVMKLAAANNAGGVGSPVTLSLGMGGTALEFDMCPLDATRFAVIRCDLGPNTILATVNAATLGAILTVPLGVSTLSPYGFLATAGEGFYIAYQDFGTGTLRILARNDDGTLSSKFAPVVVTGALPAVDTAGICRLDSANVSLVWSTLSGGLTTTYTRGVTSAGALKGVQRAFPYLMPISKPWLYNGNQYLAVANSSALLSPLRLQRTLFVVDITDNFISSTLRSRLVANVAQRLHQPDYGHSCTVSSPSAGTFVFASNVTYRATQLANRTGVNAFTLDMVNAERFLTTQVGPDLQIAGAVPFAFDGFNAFEQGFLQYPEVSSTSLVAGGAGTGSLSAGVYWYAFCYAVVDRNGVVHRSNPSVPVSVTVVATGSVTATIPPLVLTAHGDIFSRVYVEVYRGVVGSASPMHNITSLFASIPTSDPFGTVTTAIDTFADTSIATLAALYIHGGSLANFPPPPYRISAAFKGCLFVVSEEDGSIWQSKPYVVGEGIAFSEALRVLLPTEERATAMVAMDDKLIVWTATAIFIVYGEPFDDKGNNGSLAVQRVAADVGCTDPRSVVCGADGAFFMSGKGYYLLTRSLQAVHAGANVEPFVKSYSANSFAVLAGDMNEIRLGSYGASASSPSTSLVSVLNNAARSEMAPYGKWSTWDLSPAMGDPITGVVCGGSFYWATVTGEVYKESRSLYTDVGAYVPMLIETGPFQPAGVQGFARCKRIGVLGQFRSRHWVHIAIANNYATSYTQSSSWNSATLQTMVTESLFVGPIQQTASAYQIRIYDAVDGAIGTGEGFTLTGLLLEVGIKAGSAAKRLPATAKG